MKLLANSGKKVRRSLDKKTQTCESVDDPNMLTGSPPLCSWTTGSARATWPQRSSWGAGCVQTGEPQAGAERWSALLGDTVWTTSELDSSSNSTAKHWGGGDHLVLFSPPDGLRHSRASALPRVCRWSIRWPAVQPRSAISLSSVRLGLPSSSSTFREHTSNSSSLWEEDHGDRRQPVRGGGKRGFDTKCGYASQKRWPSLARSCVVHQFTLWHRIHIYNMLITHLLQCLFHKCIS